MSERALIIAISQYPIAQGLLPVGLDAVPQAARDFYDWLRNVKNVPAGNIILCKDQMTLPNDQPAFGLDPNGNQVQLIYGTSAQDVRRAVLALLQMGTNLTDVLWVYCAGHGFSWANNPNDAGVGFLVTSEFQNASVDGNATISLTFLQTFLQQRLSGQRHFYFIDVCRNCFDAGTIDPPLTLGIALPRSNNADAKRYRMYSAPNGVAAPANNAFSKALVDGLNGKGRAKTWVKDEMWVTFPRLASYVSTQVNLPPDPDGTADDARILKVDPYKQACTIEVRNPMHADGYSFRVTAGQLVAEYPIDQLPFQLQLDPSERPYTFSLVREMQQYRIVTPVDAGNLDMFDPCGLVFDLVPSPQVPTPAPAVPMQLVVAAGAGNVGSPPGIPATVAESNAPAMVSVNPDFFSGTGGARLANRTVAIDGKQVAAAESCTPIEMAPGPHEVTLVEDGQQVWKSTVVVIGGSNTLVNIGKTAPLQFQRDLLTTFNQEDFRTPNLSESLGPTADWDPNLWLAFLGVTWIRIAGKFAHKLCTVLDSMGQLPDLKTGRSGLVLMIQDENGAPSFELGTTPGDEWTPMKAVEAVEGLYYAVEVMEPGYDFLSVKPAKGNAFTYATCLTPGFYTLVTLSQVSTMRVQQFSVPAWKQNDGWCAPQLSDLMTTRLLSVAQSEFARHHQVWKSAMMPSAVSDALLNGSWENAQMATFSALDARRMGLTNDVTQLLARCAHSETPGFAGDLDALRTADEARPCPHPLLLDTWMLHPEAGQNSGGFPSGQIDSGGLWLSWYAIASMSAKEGMASEAE